MVKIITSTTKKIIYHRQLTTRSSRTNLLNVPDTLALNMSRAAEMKLLFLTVETFSMYSIT